MIVFFCMSVSHSVRRCSRNIVPMEKSNETTESSTNIIDIANINYNLLKTVIHVDLLVPNGSAQEKTLFALSICVSFCIRLWNG